MKIQYLGTAAAEGIPALYCRCATCLEAARLGGKDIRTRSQAVIDDTLLIDYPQDSLAHMYSHGLNLPEMKNIIITHSHTDHFYPEDFEMRHEGFCQDIDGELCVYGNNTVCDRINGMYFENEETPLKGKLRAQHVKPFTPFEAAGYTITPLLAEHDKAETCYIYLIEKDEKSLLYAHDTGYFLPEVWEFLSGRRINYVSFDCTYAKYPAKTGGHMGLPDVFAAKQRMLDIGAATKKSVFTVNHFSHNGHLLHAELESTAKKQGFIVSYDGMSVEF